MVARCLRTELDGAAKGGLSDREVAKLVLSEADVHVHGRLSGRDFRGSPERLQGLLGPPHLEFADA